MKITYCCGYGTQVIRYHDQFMHYYNHNQQDQLIYCRGFVYLDMENMYITYLNNEAIYSIFIVGGNGCGLTTGTRQI